LHDEHFVILSNAATDPEDLPEPDYVGTSVLLEVNATLRAESVRERLTAIPGLVLLRSRET